MQNNSPSCGDRWSTRVAPKLGNHYHQTCKDVGATRKYGIYGGDDEFSIGQDATVLSLTRFMEKLQT